MILEDILTGRSRDRDRVRLMRDIVKPSVSMPPLGLRDYIEQAWPIVEPHTAFVPGWHLDAIAEHLEAVQDGEIRNLLISMPPRHGKSLTVSVFFPTWVWTFAPYTRWLYVSYAQSLSTRDSRRCRQILETPWYSQWGVALVDDQNQKMRFDNDRGGYRIATSVGGSATGEGGDYVICDDPHDIAEAYSDVKRKTVLEWWDQLMSMRLNDPKRGHRIIMMQRIHQDDLAAHVLEQGGYEHLMLPCMFEPARRTHTSIGWSDPRTRAGELLWPQQFGQTEIDALIKSLHEYGTASQLQQDPIPAGGALFKRDWFSILAERPRDAVVRCRYWDCASTVASHGDDPDYTVGTLMSRDDQGRFTVEHVVRGRATASEVERWIVQTAAADGPDVRVREEQEGGSAGKAVIAHRLKLLTGYDYRGVRPTGSKVVRAGPFAAQAEGGNVRLVQGDWNQDWLDEVCTFPFGRHDDQVDSVSGSYSEIGMDYSWSPV